MRAGVRSAAICDSLEDLARFPFTTKADLRAAYPFGFFAVPMERIARIHASSGTTGKPTVVGYTRKDIATWSSLVARSIRAAGGRRGMKVHVAYGYGLFTGGLGAHYGAEAAGCTVIPMSGGQTERQVQLIMDFAPDIIMMTPSYMLAILDEFSAPRDRSEIKRVAHRHLRRRAVGRGHPQRDRNRIWTRCLRHLRPVGGDGSGRSPGIREDQARAHDLGGSFSARGRGSAERRGGCRGRAGELVFTSLTKEGMPVIRYRTRDLTRLLPGTVTAMRRFAKITGRTDDMLIIRGVNVFPSQIEELILQCPGLAPHYEIEITRPHRLDEVLRDGGGPP